MTVKGRSNPPLPHLPTPCSINIPRHSFKEQSWQPTLSLPPRFLGHNPTKVFKNFIDGEWVDSSTGETFENRNPADTRDVVGIFQKSAKADVDAAVDAAKRAFAKWRLVPAPRRAEIVFRAAEILIERKEDYAREMTREMGKVLAETRGDVQEAIDAAYYNAGEGRRLFGPTVPSEMPNKFAMAVRQPIGVCGMITPWNFPMAISSWKLLPAIVCGNTCVIKPAQDTPLSTFNLVRALTDAGLPKGVINIVAGYGPEVGTPLAEHADVRAISLTGSSAVGRIIGGIAAKSFKHCSLELGGKNPMIVLDDANLDLAIEGGLWGGFGTTGQRCTATSRIIVQKGVYREFVERYVARAKKLKVGNGLDETVEMGPAINESNFRPTSATSRSARTKAQSSSAAAIASTKAITNTAGSWSPPSSPTSIPRCASRRKKSSAPSFRSSPATTSKTPSKSPTASSTDSRPRSTPKM
jgi:acyl-CoA reductase-like NAD-dependent aldehyde dehydrogenase